MGFHCPWLARIVSMRREKILLRISIKLPRVWGLSGFSRVVTVQIQRQEIIDPLFLMERQYTVLKWFISFQFMIHRSHLGA